MADLDRMMSTGETLQHRTRQHPMAVLSQGAGSLLALSALSAAALLSAGGEGLAGALTTLLAAAALVPLALLLRDATSWYLRHFAVSTRRIIEVEGILTRTVRDSNLDKVNDITLRQPLLGRLLDYGDLEIITGSAAGVNQLRYVPSPLRFKRAVLDNKEDFDTLARLRALGVGQPDEPFAGGGA